MLMSLETILIKFNLLEFVIERQTKEKKNYKTIVMVLLI